MKTACDGCSKNACSKESREVCSNFAKVVPESRDCADPTSACYASYWQRQGVDPQVLANDLQNQDAEQLRAALELSEERFGEELLFVAVGGLQDFLQERAKAEAISYAVSQIEGRLCSAGYEKYLEHTCKLLKVEDLNLDQATLVRLKKAAIKDLAQLPAALVSSLPPSNDKGELAFRAFGLGAAKTAAEIIETRLEPRDLAGIWAQHERAAYQAIGPDQRLTCSVQSDSIHPACFALLLPELGKAAAGKLKTISPSKNQVAAVIESAAVSFCATYGPEAEKAHGTCLLATPSKLKSVLSKIKALAQTSFNFVNVQETAKALALKGIPANEIAERLLPDLARAFSEWSQALKVAVSGVGGSQAWIDRTGVVLQAAAAAASRDYPELLAVVAEALEPGQPLASLKLPKEAMASIGFVARLAAANTPEDAKKVFEEEAAPLGTYKLKYERYEDVTIAVNAFVGPFFGYGWYDQVKDDTDHGLVTRPLSAPLGVDFTFVHSDTHHGGVLISLIDPFGPGTINEDSEVHDFDWGAVLTPGVLLRWGIGGSPFTLLGGVVYQPFARADSQCTEDSGEQLPCWKGTLQVGGALAIDIPLVVLR